MKITLFCSDPSHPVNAYLLPWAQAQSGRHEIDFVERKSQLKGGDILFLVSCSEIIDASDREKYRSSLVLHASDLPKGRGWSPHIWDLLQGAEAITLSMLEAEDKVDSGRVWKKTRIEVPKHALWNEINHLLFSAEVQLIDFAVNHFGHLTPEVQSGIGNTSYFPKRTPQDSQIDVNTSIAKQFDLIRVCDPNRFPAYFYHLGQRYILKIEKSNEQ